MKTWLITGCSSGLGRSLARAVLKKGYNAVVTARDVQTIMEFQEKYPEKALVIPLDVTDTHSVCQAMEQAAKYFGGIDVLVNNAGYGYRAAVEEADDGALRMFNTNFWGAVTMIKAVLPHMRGQRSGAVINVSSIAGLRTAPGSGYYAASKCALEGMSEGLLYETAPLGIKVMVVEPGAFRTDFAGRSLTQSDIVIDDYNETAGKRRIGNDKAHGTQQGDPDKGAELIIEAIERDDAPFRLLLGSDAVKFADEVMKHRIEEYDKWRNFSQRSDFS